MHATLGSILRDRRLWTGPFPWTLLALVVLNALVVVWKKDLETERRDNLLLHPGPVVPGAGEPPPRFDKSVGENLGEFWSFIPDARRQPLVVVSGMSQMYAINDARAGDEIIAERLDDALHSDGIRAFGLAAPNLNNEEALLYLVASSLAPETHPDVFVYGLCFDKFRNVDVRGALLEFLRGRPAVQASLREACEGASTRFPMACSKVTATLDGLSTARGASASERKDEDLESKIRAAAARAVPMVDSRKDLNVAAQMLAYSARNRALGIKSSTKRPIIRSRYELNQQLLELIVDVARRRDVRLALYIIPFNRIAENPYVPEEYESFKRWAEALAKSNGIAFANFETIVDARDWGLSNGEPDYKHFRAEGHARTAGAILEAFGPLFRSSPTRGRAGP
jgi:hypothetical protein